MGKYSSADINRLKEQIVANPYNFKLHYDLGACYLKLGRYSEAAEEFKETIFIKSDYADAHFWLGLAFNKLGSYQEAAEAYKEAIQLRPDWAEAYYSLGNAYVNLGMYTEGVKAFKEAISIKTDYYVAYYSLGQIYVNLGSKGEAVEVYKFLKQRDNKLAKELSKLINELPAKDDKIMTKVIPVRGKEYILILSRGLIYAALFSVGLIFIINSVSVATRYFSYGIYHIEIVNLFLFSMGFALIFFDAFIIAKFR